MFASNLYKLTTSTFLKNVNYVKNARIRILSVIFLFNILCNNSEVFPTIQLQLKTFIYLDNEISFEFVKKKHSQNQNKESLLLSYETKSKLQFSFGDNPIKY